MISATLNITVTYECPHCTEYNDLVEDDKLRDDGWIYKLIMPDNAPWSGACENFSKEYKESFGEDYCCPKCGKAIDIGRINY